MTTIQFGITFFFPLLIGLIIRSVFTNKVIQLLLKRLKLKNAHIKELFQIHNYMIDNYNRNSKATNSKIRYLESEVTRLEGINLSSRIKKRERNLKD
jgi:hypothetical protein